MCSLLLASCGAGELFRSLFILSDAYFATLSLQSEPQYLHSPGDPFQETSIYVQVLHFHTGLNVMSCSLEFLKRR